NSRIGSGPLPVTAWLPAAVKTDDEGRFRLDGLVPGLKYTLLVGEPGRGPRVRPSHLRQNVTGEAGKTKDLGELERGGCKCKRRDQPSGVGPLLVGTTTPARRATHGPATARFGSPEGAAARRPGGN